jgi:hypothetical protein
MHTYSIEVRYRTNSGCNITRVNVDALDIEHAMQLASDKVRRRRGVIRIDGCDWSAP